MYIYIYIYNLALPVSKILNHKIWEIGILIFISLAYYVSTIRMGHEVLFQFHAFSKSLFSSGITIIVYILTIINAVYAALL